MVVTLSPTVDTSPYKRQEMDKILKALKTELRNNAKVVEHKVDMVSITFDLLSHIVILSTSVSFPALCKCLSP